MTRRPAPVQPDLLVVVDPSAPTAMHRQVYAGLRQAVLQGRLPTGARLPSSRSLAADLHIARNTVTTAFDQLRAEGYITGWRGAGTRVCDVIPDEMLKVARPPAAAPSSAAPAQFAVSRRGAALVAAGRLFPSAAESPRAFTLGMPALDAFPAKLWARLVARRWRRTPDLGYGDPAGYAPLRRAIADYVGAARGVRCTADQVVIVSGAQHAFDLAARLLLDPGDAVWVEDPGYLGARSAVDAAGARQVPVPVDGEGLVVAEGRSRAPEARLVHVTPSHQFPLGCTMSPRRRLELLEWARTGGWILEDDYDSEFRYAGRPLPSLQGLDEHGRVLYVGSFGKTIYPALRMGYLVVPDGAVDAFAAARAAGDRHPPLVDQAVVADFLADGHFARHLRRMRRLYAERQAALLEAARRSLTGQLDVAGDAAGLHLVGRLRVGIGAVPAAARAAAHQVRVTPLARFAGGPLEPAAREALLLGYAAVPVPAIHHAVERLAAALDEAEKEAR